MMLFNFISELSSTVRCVMRTLMSFWSINVIVNVRCILCVIAEPIISLDFLVLGSPDRLVFENQTRVLSRVLSHQADSDLENKIWSYICRYPHTWVLEWCDFSYLLCGNDGSACQKKKQFGLQMFFERSLSRVFGAPKYPSLPKIFYTVQRSFSPKVLYMGTVDRIS